MAQRPSDGIGERLSYYRKLSGLSAERLSHMVPMSRAVIANIESGRKTDVTVDELLALAWALDVPPVALALPVEQPNVFVRTSGSEDSGWTYSRAVDVIEWFMFGWRRGSTPTPPQTIATTRLRMLTDYAKTRSRVDQVKRRLDSGDTSAAWADIYQEESKRLDDLIEGLTGLGVDLTDFKADETGLSSGDD